ncbi:MAG: MaoC family dehydratase [Spirosomataceae bacterium]
MIEVGTEFSHRFRFTQDDVVAFSQVSGDDNPLHLDESYAAQTQFGRPIMHGMLGASIFSKVIGTLFPGKGSVYVKQTLEFKRPMFVDTDYEAVFKVVAHYPEKHFADISTQLIDVATQKVTTTGVATVMHKEEF